MPALPSAADEMGLSAREEVAPRDWLAFPGQKILMAQTLSQHAGFAITLLAFDETDTGDDDSET